eukprot:2343171-Pyramimonas_sp.AAC.2
MKFTRCVPGVCDSVPGGDGDGFLPNLAGCYSALRPRVALQTLLQRRLGQPLPRHRRYVVTHIALQGQILATRSYPGGLVTPPACTASHRRAPCIYRRHRAGRTWSPPAAAPAPTSRNLLPSTPSESEGVLANRLQQEGGWTAVGGGHVRHARWWRHMPHGRLRQACTADRGGGNRAHHGHTLQGAEPPLVSSLLRSCACALSLLRTWWFCALQCVPVMCSVTSSSAVQCELAAAFREAYVATTPASEHTLGIRGCARKQAVTVQRQESA